MSRSRRFLSWEEEAEMAATVRFPTRPLSIEPPPPPSTPWPDSWALYPKNIIPSLQWVKNWWLAWDKFPVTQQNCIAKVCQIKLHWYGKAADISQYSCNWQDNGSIFYCCALLTLLSKVDNWPGLCEAYIGNVGGLRSGWLMKKWECCKAKKGE